MSHSDVLRLPSYLEHTPEVAARFAELEQRPIVMSVEGLGRSFEAGGQRVEALRGVSYAVRQRELISVIGPSGCGKSTLIRILAGLDRPSTGSVELDGKPVLGPGADRGMVFQGYTLFPWLSVKRNVMFGPK